MVLPDLNALLNGFSALAALAGFIGIQMKKVRLHRACMLTAVVLSAGFMASYIVYHVQAGSVRMQKQGWIRPAYFAILISHSALAVPAVVLVFASLWKALTGKYAQHRRLARWTLPIWIYVSVTGVIVYLILYW